MSELKKKIQAILAKPLLASLATLTEDGKPWVRYVTISSQENFILYFCTDNNSRKAQQIRQNPEVHLTCGELDPPDNSVYLQIQGQATILTDQKIKAAFWKEEWLRYFTGPEDPNYVMVRIESQQIEYNSPLSPVPESWDKSS